MSKNVSLLVPSLSGGGAERVVLNLAVEMAKDSRLQVEILTIRNGGTLRDLVPGNISVRQLNKKRALWSLVSLVKYFRTTKPDLVISNLRVMNVLSVVARALSMTKCKVILVEHSNLDEVFKHSGLKERLVGPLMRSTYLKADALVSVSNDSSNALAAYLKIDQDRVKTIYNPILTDSFSSSISAKDVYKWPSSFDGHSIVITAGRLTYEKDHATLLHAFRIVTRTRPVKLVILGDGSERQKLEALTQQLGLSDSVTFFGFVDNPLPFFRASNLFVLSSLYEGLGNVLVEALACGLPVVSTGLGGGPEEIVNIAGVGSLVPIQSPTELADTILEQLNSGIDELSPNLEKFSASYAAKQYLALGEGGLNSEI